MFFQDGLEVGGGDGGSGEGKREGLTRVGDEDELELGREGRGEELGEDGLADATETKERDGDGTGNDNGGHCVVYRERVEYICTDAFFIQTGISSPREKKCTTSSILFFSFHFHFQHTHPYHDEAMPRKIPIQSILPHTRSHITVRRIASCARLYRRRQLDYLAPFRRPANPPYSPLNDKLQNVLQTHGQPAASPEGDVAYETASTAPVATSLQEVPRHEEASRLVDPLPAMKDASGAEEEHSKEKMKARTKEMIVQGIAVPPKPIPPGEEGW